MANRLAVLGVTALLIAVALFAVVLTASSAVGTGAGARSAPVAAVRPAATISVTPLYYEGYAQYTFYPGQDGRVYFAVDDPSLDDKVTVQINDGNATRDGLTNPVASWIVNASSGTYTSTTHGIEYTLPTSLVYGGNWNVTASGAVGGFYSNAFTVQTYEFGLSGPEVVLPGFGGVVTFFIYGEASGLPYTQISSVNLTAVYFDGTTFAYQTLALSQSHFPAGTASGSVSFTLPLNASYEGQILIVAWANVTNAGSFVEEQEYDGYIGLFEYASVSFNAAGVDNYVFANTPVTVTVTPYMYSGYCDCDQRAPGLPISFNFLSGGTAVANSAIPGDPPTTVNSGASGQATILFLAATSVFSTTAVNQVNISVLVQPSGPSSPAVYYNETEQFYVATNGTSLASVTVAFGAATYYGGEAGTATWKVVPIGGGTVSGWNAIAYELIAVPADSPSTVLAIALITGTSGTISFTAPAAFTGYIELEVVAHNQTLYSYAYTEADVFESAILLSPSETQYNPGDTIVISVTTEGPAFAGATLYESVEAYGGGILGSGVVTGGSFSFTVPVGAAPTELYVEVYAQSTALGTFATSDLYLYESGGIAVTVGISTVSKYSDGSFQPGQTLTVTWNIAAYGVGTVSPEYYVSLWTANGWFGDSAAVSEIVTSATSGSFQYTVPSGAPAGSQSLYVAVDAAGACDNSCYTSGQVSYQVNPSPSALNMELGAGSGLTVGWLILLIVIIVVALLLVLLFRRGRAPKNPPSSYMATTGSMSPPAPAPSTPPAAEWQGSPPSSPPAAGDAPPALPTPPPGAQ